MRLNFVTAYFAIVSVVSVLVVGFELVNLLQFLIIKIWPQLADADLARLMAMQADNEEIGSYQLQQLQPLYIDFIKDCISMVVFAGLLWWHLPRLLRSETQGE
ncbi:MAG: hypothetical protein OXT03_00225 [Alphaproteobacteria bacterium]|nr:hypothetical protein [Alphaproteobacteria bacterium]MDD9841259.1 hypothetical protein [Alphaproteobacteria bacterium]